MDTVATGQSGMMGLKIGTDGKIWFVNYTQSSVLRLDPTPAVNDVSVVSIDAPTTILYDPTFYSEKYNECDPSLVPIVTIENMGSATLTSAVITYQLDNMVPVIFNWSGSLAAGMSAQVSLAAYGNSPGNHVLTVTSSMPNGVADENDMNDTKSGSYRGHSSPAAIPFSETFSSGTFPYTGWAEIGYNLYNPLYRVPNVGGFGVNTGCLKMDNYSGNDDITGQLNYAILPLLDLSTASAAIGMTFSLAHTQSSGRNDRLRVKASTDCGATWDLLYDKAGATLSTVPPSLAHSLPVPHRGGRRASDCPLMLEIQW